MKPVRLLIIVACFSIVFAMFSGVGSALNQNEATASAIWSTTAVSQGSSVTVTVFFSSNSPDTLKIYYLGLHFDWMASDTFVGLDLSDEPITIPGHGSYTFNPMFILIPEDVTAGEHSYFIGIDGLQAETNPFSWNSPDMTLRIQGPEERTYNELLTAVSKNITKAENTTYQSSEARTLLQKAKNSYEEASSLASQTKWDEAVSSLQNAANYLKQADTAERNYIKTQGQQRQMLIIGGAVAAAVVVVILVIFMVRRKKKQKQIQTPPSTPTVDQPPAET